MGLEEWKSQVKRGTLEFCVLLLIRQEPRYGYELISRLERYPLMAARENTMYPLLRRLLREGLITASWQEGVQGLPPRKYYTLTESGRDYLAALSREWDDLTAVIAEIKGGGRNGQAAE